MSSSDLIKSALAPVILVLACALPAQAELRFTAKIYEQGSNKQKLLYSYKSELNAKGTGREVVNTFTSPDGKVVAVETTEISATDWKVSAYRMSQRQLGAEGAVEVANGEAKFTYTKDGKIKTGSEKAGEDFVVGPAIPVQLEANWDKLMKGEKLKRRLAVLDRQETVGFEFAKDKDADMNGQKVTVIKMKPSSFIIAAIVNPIYFYFTADGKALKEMHGRQQVKKDEGGKFKDLDAEVVYEAGGNSK